MNLPILKSSFTSSLNEQLSAVAVKLVSELLKVESPIQTKFDILGLNPAKVYTVARFPPSWEDPTFSPTASVTQRAAATRCPSSGSWPGAGAMPPAQRCSMLQGEISHLDGRDPRADPGYELSHVVLCNNWRTVKCNLGIEIQTMWQLVKILLITNIFNSNRDFPDKDILALTGKTKTISFENHMIFL